VTPAPASAGPPRHVVCLVATVAMLALGACGTVNPASDDAQVQSGLKAIAGIAQDGFTLGDPRAPWTLSVISSPTNFELDALVTQLPELTRRFVRSGRLRLQMRTPTKGPYGLDGSEREVAGVLLAASLQGRFWDALVRFVPRYTGAVSTAALADLLRRSGVPDVDRAMADRTQARVRAALNRADEVAAAAKGGGRVLYLLGRSGGELHRLDNETALRNIADEVGQTLR
jgi:hypothetical protein